MHFESTLSWNYADCTLIFAVFIWLSLSDPEPVKPLPQEHLVGPRFQLPGEERGDLGAMHLLLAHQLAALLPEKLLQEILHGTERTRRVTGLCLGPLPRWHPGSRVTERYSTGQHAVTKKMMLGLRYPSWCKING